MECNIIQSQLQILKNKSNDSSGNLRVYSFLPGSIAFQQLQYNSVLSGRSMTYSDICYWLFTFCVCFQAMLNAAPSFLNVFYRLVASIVQEGRQRGDGDAGNINIVH